MQTYHLDPDCRPMPKTNRWCCRCQKDLKPGKGVYVTVDWDKWQVSLTPGNDLIGNDCLKQIMKADQ